MCDQAFPDRDGWSSEFYAEFRTWIATPPWFRSWIEHEQHAATLRTWQLGVLSGLLQTEDYARAILAVNPGVTDDQVSERLAARLARCANCEGNPPAGFAWHAEPDAGRPGRPVRPVPGQDGDDVRRRVSQLAEASPQAARTRRDPLPARPARRRVPGSSRTVPGRVRAGTGPPASARR